MQTRERLDRLWRTEEEAFTAGHFRRAKRILEILWRHDPDSQRVRNHLDVAELRPQGPDWKFISMSNARLDRVYARGDDDPADLATTDEPEWEPPWEPVAGVDFSDIREGEDAADDLEERLTRRSRGKVPPVTGMSHQKLDQFPGNDADPLEAMTERQVLVCEYLRRRREIRAMLARGDLRQAKDALHYLSASEIEGAARWAGKKLQELGENQ